MSTPNDLPCVNVMYDGSCPLCVREVQHYQQLKANQPLHWVDVSAPTAVLPEGKTSAELMQRFHVQTAEGRLLDGARAFVHLWQQLPGWRCLAMVCRLPGVVPLMEVTYNVFLRYRPALQRWYKRKCLQSNRVGL